MNTRTVSSVIKKKPSKLNPHLLDVVEQKQLQRLDLEIRYDIEWDELWSYVGKKTEPYWTWYVIERNTGVIVAWKNGRRSNEVLKKMLERIESLATKYAFTDSWKAYVSLLPKHYTHLVGEDQTWKIEHRNLNFRTHLKWLQRKTICFSKNKLMHDNVIEMYIEKYYYKHRLYADSLSA